jgi:hypothetical protein
MYAERPLTRSHIRRDLSRPLDRASLPEGCTAKDVTVPLWPPRMWSRVQSYTLHEEEAR